MIAACSLTAILFVPTPSVPIPKFASSLYSAPGEFRNQRDTSNVLIPSVVLVSKFARRSISECGELRNHDTSNLLILVWFSDLKFLNVNATIISGPSNPPHERRALQSTPALQKQQ